MKHNYAALKTLLTERGWSLVDVTRILQDQGQRASYSSVKIWASEKSPKCMSDENINILKNYK